MKPSLPFLTIFLATILAASAFGWSPEGGWVGTISLTGKNLPLQMHFDHGKSGITGKASLPTERIFDQPLNSVQFVEPDRLTASLKTDAGDFQFSGRYQENKFSGDLIFGHTKGSFSLIHVVAVQPSSYFGVYKKEDGHLIAIKTWDELGDNQLTYLEDSGRVGPLFAASETEFFAGAGLLIPLPEQAKITFQFDTGHQVTGLTWQEEGKTTRLKRVETISDQDVAFQSGDVRLSGSLVTPQSEGPHPAVVFVHGSGPVTRDFMGPLPYLFATHGIAVLSYDKRGIGKSGGNWLEAGFNDLASDALAAIQFLKTRKEIDPKRIGLLGISQGGWIVPLAASQSDDVDFAILISTAAVTPAVQGEQMQREEMKLAGSRDDEIAQVLAKNKSDLNQLRNQEVQKQLEEDVKTLRAKQDKTLTQNGPGNPLFLLFLARILDFDPLPYLEKVKCPVLAIYGELDRGVPIADNKEKLESALKKDNQKVTVVVIPKSDHALLECETGSMSEFPYLRRFSPEFLSTLWTWTAKQTQP